MKEFLYGKTIEELKLICGELNLAKYTAKQISDWLYKKNLTSLQAMTNINLKVRQALAEKYEIGINLPVKCFTSTDGTKKYLFDYGVIVEAVVIFDKERTTLCISSQAGCKLNCAFCATGQQGFKKNLSSYEILNIFRCIDECSKIDNIVFMGMGEPLDNWDNVKSCIDILTSDWGYGISSRRITISTSGIQSKMNEMLTQTKCNIAVSLHSAISSERAKIMPIEKAFPIADIVKLLQRFDWHGQRRLTFEYIVFDFNHSDKHINALTTLLKNLECRINLIRYHSIKENHFKSADDKTIIKFRDSLNSKGLLCTIRASKGEDIFAACGLLSGQYKQ